MVSRVYVEKKPGFDVEAQQLAHELRDILGIERLEGLRLVNRYDVEGITGELFAQCVPTVFSEPQSDVATLDAGRGRRGGVRGGVPAGAVRPACRLGQRVHPAHQPGRAPRGAQREGVHAGGRARR